MTHSMIFKEAYKGPKEHRYVTHVSTFLYLPSGKEVFRNRVLFLFFFFIFSKHLSSNFFYSDRKVRSHRTPTPGANRDPLSLFSPSVLMNLVMNFPSGWAWPSCWSHTEMLGASLDCVHGIQPEEEGFFGKT